MIKFKPIPENIQSKIEDLHKFFQEEQNIVFAYLFGGLAKGRQTPLSDVDIAVYLRSLENFDYLEILSKVTDVLGTEEVDLIILNTAPISLVGRILKTRKLLVDKDPPVRHSFESLKLREFFDFQYREKEILDRRYKIG